MQTQRLPRWRWQYAAALAVAALVWWQRALVWRGVLLLFYGMLLALTVLPVMRRLEGKLSPGLSATLSMSCLTAAGILFLLILVPPVIAQGRMLAAMTPALLDRARGWAEAARSWLAANGMPVEADIKTTLLEKGEQAVRGAAPQMLSRVSGMVGGLGLWLPAPLFAFYFLRDRRRIGDWLLTLVPVGGRALTVKLLREMRRETAGYLRGQLLVSCAVGGLTALGLLVCGVPAWLLLGLLMGVLELIPYVGPFLGGTLVLLFSLQEGLSRTLWAMGVVLLVQQLESGMISPGLMSGATRLHPVTVLLCVMLGGAAAGVAGILVAIPLALCVRAALRVLSLHAAGRAKPADP